MAFPGDWPRWRPCVNGRIGLSCPASVQCGPSPHHPPRAGASESETHLTAARLAEPSAFHRVLSKTASPSTSQLVSTPASQKLASARRRPARCSFRPRRFSRPRRFPPPADSRACCIPQPIVRFIGFPRPGVACLRSPPRFPTDACPSELFPSEKRSPRHREALPPCRSPATPARLRGLVPLGSPSQRRFVSEPHCSMLSWASPLGAPPERDTLRMPSEEQR